MSTAITEKIKHKAQQLGFDLVGVAPVEPIPELSFYKEWIDAGYAGKMEYLSRNVEQRTDVSEVVSEARSVIVCAMVYHTSHPLSTECKDSRRGWVSRYAWGDDYHNIIQKKLIELSDFIKTESKQEVVSRLYVDTGPVVDRVYAKYAGIGWFGKNTCIIDQQKGSWFFLGEIITNLELETDMPVPDRCGTCNRCMEACPTDAILEPYVLDARLCISYLTIELRDEIPLELREQMGNHIFGCDICQDVCPWNRETAVTEEPAFQPREDLFNPGLQEVAQLSTEEFGEKFRKSPVKRAKRTRFLRNVAVAMGNSGDSNFLPVLEDLIESEEPLVSKHAKWATDNIQNKIEKDMSSDKKLQEIIERITKRIVKTIQPEKVVLFGSHAYGIPDNSSDLDFLIVVKQSDQPRYKRARNLRRQLWGMTEIPKDLLVYTEAEINEWKNVKEAFITSVVEQGKILYENKERIN